MNPLMTVQAPEGAMTAAPTTDPKWANAWRRRLSSATRYREDLLKDWKDNVNYRVQKPFAEASIREDTVAVPEDWARSKQKAAQLMFQVPKVILTPKAPQHADAAPVFQAVLNHKLHHEIKAEAMLDECLADVINAAGFMVSVVGIDIVTETRQVPESDPSQVPPEMQAALLQGGALPMVPMEVPIYESYSWKRISPAAFLWPAEFTGSNWDEAPWLGYETWLPLEEARKKYKLPADFKGASPKPALLSEDVLPGTSRPQASDEYVKVQVVWYKRYLYSKEAKHPEELGTMVFVDGLDEPVEDGPTSWQKYVPEEIDPTTGEMIPGHYIGIRKFPIRVATLTYISDLAIPPSDSQAGRPQVRELIRSRSQMLRQRDRSIPVRWADSNRIDPQIMDRLQSGEWQDIIPVNGPGERVLGEIARAQYPRENFQFQNVIGSDLDRAWSLSNNQLATQGASERSATEVQVMQSAATVRLEYEKARVARYVVGGVEVLAGLVQLFADRVEYVQLLGPDGAKRLEAWDRNKVQGEFAFEIVPDSGDRVDPAVRQERILKLYNLAANDPTINRPQLTRQLVESFGMDPAVILTQPPPPPPEKPNLSYRFSGEDLLNPFVVALLTKSGEITPDEIKAAKLLIEDATGVPMAADVAPPAGPEGAPPAGGPSPEAAGPVEPPETVSPILKRAVDGSRMT